MSGRIDRIEFEELGDELRGLLAPRYERLGYLGEFFKCAAHQPEALAAFIRFTESAKGNVPKKLVEVIALTASTATDNAYERNQHERLCMRLGYGRDWISQIQLLEQNEFLAEDESLVQGYVLAALARRELSAAMEALVREFGQENAVAISMVTARYIAHSVMIASFAIGPVVPSIWEDGFSG